MKKHYDLYIPCLDCNQEGRNRGIKLVQKKDYDSRKKHLGVNTSYECAAGYNHCARVDLYNKISEIQKDISKIERTSSQKISHHRLPDSLRKLTPIRK